MQCRHNNVSVGTPDVDSKKVPVHCCDCRQKVAILTYSREKATPVDALQAKPLHEDFINASCS